MGDIKQEILDRLKDIEILSEFDLRKRVSVVNGSLCNLFGMLDILKDVLTRAKQDGTDIKLPTQSFEEIVTVLDSIGLIIFLTCNAKKASFEKVIKDVKINQFIQDVSIKEKVRSG